MRGVFPFRAAVAVFSPPCDKVARREVTGAVGQRVAVWVHVRVSGQLAAAAALAAVMGTGMETGMVTVMGTGMEAAAAGCLQVAYPPVLGPPLSLPQYNTRGIREDP